MGANTIVDFGSCQKEPISGMKQFTGNILTSQNKYPENIITSGFGRSLSTVEGKLPPGFRFHPRDEELIYDYLLKWVGGCAQQTPFLIEVDLNKCEPWDIPDSACVGGKEWYFYSQRDRKYATGLRTNRATVSGYWKATGKDRSVIRKGTLIGMRKTLVFYTGRAPKGKKTDWVMHEFRLEGTLGPGPKNISVKEDWVLCRVFCKNRSEITDKEEAAGSSSHEEEASASSPSLPPLTEPYIIFDHDEAQVPCFSIFSQTTPNFSLLSPPQMDPTQIHPTNLMPNFGGMLQPHDIPLLGSIYNFNNNNNNNNNNYNNNDNLQSLNSSSALCPEKKVIKAVLNRLTKIESGSSSFGDGSSESYLSDVGLSSMWN